MGKSTLRQKAGDRAATDLHIRLAGWAKTKNRSLPSTLCSVNHSLLASVTAIPTRRRSFILSHFRPFIQALYTPFLHLHIFYRRLASCASPSLPLWLVRLCLLDTHICSNDMYSRHPRLRNHSQQCWRQERRYRQRCPVHHWWLC